jgi:hypothetical protein
MALLTLAEAYDAALARYLAKPTDWNWAEFQEARFCKTHEEYKQKMRVETHVPKLGRIARWLAWLFVLSAVASATTLTGTVTAPNGVGITGQLIFSLSQQAALATTGGCGGPAQIVPTYQVIVTVTAGALIGTPTLIGVDCLLPQNLYYNVIARDSNGNVLFTDKWIISGATQDIGMIVSAVVTGTTQTLGGVGVLLTQPTATQTIVQPPSTYAQFNNLQSTVSMLLPDGSYCDTTNCTFIPTVGFVGGINTGLTVGSQIWIGDGAGSNFYNRTFSGPNDCSATGDGWMAVKIDVTPPMLVVCVGHMRYGIAIPSF